MLCYMRRQPHGTVHAVVLGHYTQPHILCDESVLHEVCCTRTLSSARPIACASMMDFFTYLDRKSAELANTWIMELVASLLSLSSLAGLVGILAFADGQQILVWHGITLNTLVSAIATVSKLCALYAAASAISQTKWNMASHIPVSLLEFEAVDMASRGAFGCLQLLLRGNNMNVQHVKANGCASLMIRSSTFGAMAFLIAIAFDPFTQQLVQYRRFVEFSLEDTATIPFARRYSGGTIHRVQATNSTVDPTTGIRGEVILVAADFSMQAAILNGLTRSVDEVKQQLPLRCPSANCTWESVESLAVCSKCEDVRSYVHTYASGPADLVASVSLSEQNLGTAFGQSTIHQLPNGAWISNADSDEADGGTKLLMTAFSTGNPVETIVEIW